jgi:16S rRNA (cytidine1402-2'-O)-methyltransferase
MIAPSLNEDAPFPLTQPATAPGTLYVVATPIGNLSDLSSRAREVLAAVDLVACEDTRTTRPLLAVNGITATTVALHEHNEQSARTKLVESLLAGKSIALVSDAGTPAISDPGALVVEAAHLAGIRVVPIPGSNAAISAYSASGFLSDRFLFAGFLPASAGARRKAIADLDAACPVILYEAPHRILDCVEDLAAGLGPDRDLVIARELTKKFEEIARMKLGEARDWIESGAHRQQGEFVLVIGPKAEVESEDSGEAERVLRILLEDHSVSDAARIAARLTDGSKNALYERALALAATLPPGKARKPR